MTAPRPIPNSGAGILVGALIVAAGLSVFLVRKVMQSEESSNNTNTADTAVKPEAAATNDNTAKKEPEVPRGGTNSKADESLKKTLETIRTNQERILKPKNKPGQKKNPKPPTNE